MKLKITNLTAHEITILGLPRGGRIAGNATETFKVSEMVLVGYDGVRMEVASVIQKMKADSVITYSLYPETGDMTPRVFCEKVTVTHADLTAAATTQSINLIPEALPANAVITHLRREATVLFADGAVLVTSATITLGVTGTADALLGATDVFTGGSTAVDLLTPFLPVTTSKNVTALFTVNGGATVAACTTGSITFEIYYQLV